MAKNLIINGATYNGVESLDIPTSDGGKAIFPDTSGDTVEPEKMLKGITAHDKSGAKVAGTFTVEAEITEQDSLIDQIEQALIGKTGGGGETPPVVQPLTVTENGTYTAPDGVDGYSPVVVNVSEGTTEIWTLTLENGTEITKEVVIA